jgi:hypothetical protein
LLAEALAALVNPGSRMILITTVFGQTPLAH